MTDPRPSARVRAAVAALLAAAGLGLTASPSRAVAPTHWVGAWMAGSQSNGPASDDQTYRLLVHTSTGGRSVRLRFSNAYGTAPLVLRHVTVALPARTTAPGPDVVPASVRPVRFGRADTVTVPAGQDRRSSPVAFDVPADGWLAVSFHAPGSAPTTTYHMDAWSLSWQSPPGTGDQVADTAGAALSVPSYSWTYLTGVEVTAPRTVSTVVALGDSITDCVASAPELNQRWPDLLNRRLAARPGTRRFSVVNAGINGNELTEDRGGNADYGAAGVRRLERDVFSVPGVSTLILFEGVNDIGSGRTTAQVVAAYERVVRAAHARGLRVLVSTLTPLPLSGTSTRSEVNAWVLAHARLFDGVLHLGEVVQAPGAAELWHPLYGAGDETHPNPAGVQLMADSIPLQTVAGR